MPMLMISSLNHFLCTCSALEPLEPLGGARSALECLVGHNSFPASVRHLTVSRTLRVRPTPRPGFSALLDRIEENGVRDGIDVQTACVTSDWMRRHRSRRCQMPSLD